MPIDEELAKRFGLNQGALGQRAKSDSDWLGRLMQEVIEPFDQMLKDHQKSYLAKARSGLTPEIIREVQGFNEAVSHTLSMLLTLFVVSNIPGSTDPDGSMSMMSIRMLALRTGLEAEKMLKEAKASRGPPKGERGE